MTNYENRETVNAAGGWHTITCANAYMRVCHPPAAFTVSRFSYAVTGCSFVYALTLQQSIVIIPFIFLQALCNFFHKKEIVQGFLMYNALREEILKYLSDMSIKQVDLMRRYNINRNTLKKYISIIHRI